MKNDFVRTHLIRIVVLVFMLASILSINGQTVYAADSCPEYTGTNANAQSYEITADPMYSYLFKESGGYLRMQYYLSTKQLIGEHYNSSFNLVSTFEVTMPDALFGTIYRMGEYYYLITGGDNTEESDDFVSYRITKYDSDWNEIKNTPMLGWNTYGAFAAGSCRVTDNGTYLFVRTCHEMYTTEDGLHHQANVTFSVNADTLEVIDSFYGIMNYNYGYVSHSFNQFIKTDGNILYGMDHGDARPRSLIISKYNKDISEGYFYGRVTPITLMTFTDSDTYHYNYTGATAGGLEVMDDTLLAAGNSCYQDEAIYNPYSNRNIFVSSMDKNTNQVTTNWYTSYPLDDMDHDTSTPQLVKLSGTTALLMWTCEGKLNYCTIDQYGNRISDIYVKEGTLSDCHPLLNGTNVIWYTYDGSEVDFFSLSTSNLNNLSVAHVNNGHVYDEGTLSEDHITYTCTKCGSQIDYGIATSANLWWNTTGANTGSFSSYISSTQEVGAVAGYWFDQSFPSGYSNLLTEYTVTSSDPSVARVTPDSRSEHGRIDFLKPGTAEITFQSSWQPGLKATKYFTVKPEEVSIITQPVDTTGYIGEYVSFHVEAAGTEPAYQWQYSADGGNTWKNCSTTTATFKVKASEALNGRLLRCIVTGAAGNTVTSDAAKLTVQARQPVISSVANAANGVKISWGKITGAAKYRVFYKVAGGKWTKITDTTANTYTWTGAKSGTKYTFTVRCLNASGSYNSTFDSTGKTITYIAAPEVTKAENTVSGVKVTWGKVDGAAKYRLFYKTGSGKWTKITDTNADNYTWTGAVSGTKYTFVVRAVNAAGTAYTSALNTSGKSVLYIKAPKVTSVSNTASGIKVDWGAVTGAENYRLFYKVSGGKWTRITDTTSTSYTWAGAASGTTYTFVVRAVNAAGTAYTSALDTNGMSITAQ